METKKTRIALLWAAVMTGFVMHTVADMMPQFWGEDIVADPSGSAPVVLLAFMVAVSYTVPVAGMVCTLFGRGRAWAVANAVLAVAMLLFNLFHTAELFSAFNAVQLLVLPVILAASALLARDSVKLARRRADGSK